MTSSHTPRLPVQAPEGIKSPVATATTATITLSGLQTVNGYTLNVNDRVLVKDQDISAENGIYVALEGDWVRSQDWKVGSQVANGAIVLDNNTGDLWRANYAGVLDVDTTAVTFNDVVAGGGGNTTVEIQPRQTATEGQTVFSTPISYYLAPKFFDVHLGGGAWLRPGADFTINTNGDLILTDGVTAGTWLDVVLFRPKITTVATTAENVGEFAPIQVANMAALRNVTAYYDGQQFELLGHTNAGVGGGTFYYDASDTTSADDNGMVAVITGGQRLKREITENNLSPEDFGITTEDTSTRSEALTAMQAVIDAGYELDLRRGKYYTDGSLVVRNYTKILSVRGTSEISSNSTDPTIICENTGGATGNGNETFRVDISDLKVTNENDYVIVMRCRPYQWDCTGTSVEGISNIGILLEGEAYERENRFNDMYFRYCRHNIVALQGAGECSDNFVEEGTLGFAGDYGYTGLMWENTSNCRFNFHFYGKRKTDAQNIVSFASNVITITAHGLYTGDPVFLETTGTLPTGLEEKKFYYVIRVDADTFKLTSSMHGAFNNADIVSITDATGSGTHTVVCDGTHAHIKAGINTVVNSHLPQASGDGHSKLSIKFGNPAQVTVNGTVWGGDGANARECIFRCYNFTAGTDKSVLVNGVSFNGGANKVPLFDTDIESNMDTSLLRVSGNLYAGSYSCGSINVAIEQNEALELAHTNSTEDDLNEVETGYSPYVIWTKTGGGNWFFRPVNGDARQDSPVYLENRSTDNKEITISSGAGVTGVNKVWPSDIVKIYYNPTEGSYNAVRVGDKRRILQKTITQDWASIADGSTAQSGFALTGAEMGDMVSVSMDIDIQGLVLSGYISSADVVTVVATNNTGGAVDLPSGDMYIRAISPV